MQKVFATQIKLLQKEKTLQIWFSDGKTFKFTCDFLRKASPSAEAPKNTAKDLNILQIEPVGNYAIKIYFSDGHKSGLYSFQYLYELGLSQ